jgi:hypothetical protein
MDNDYSAGDDFKFGFGFLVLFALLVGIPLLWLLSLFL